MGVGLGDEVGAGVGQRLDDPKVSNNLLLPASRAPATGAGAFFHPKIEVKSVLPPVIKIPSKIIANISPNTNPIQKPERDQLMKARLI